MEADGANVAALGVGQHWLYTEGKKQDDGRRAN
jgi:hypothetical protein